MKINYILTAFSPAMFGDRATCHLRIIPKDEATELVDNTSRIMSTRVVHERLARKEFPHASPELVRYASMTPGVNALHIHYRGPPIADDGTLPTGGVVTFYLIEVEEYQAPA